MADKSTKDESSKEVSQKGQLPAGMRIEDLFKMLAMQSKMEEENVGA